MAHRFHTEVSLTGGLISLSRGETQHLIVSRVKAGDGIFIFDGNGLEYSAIVVELSKNGAILQMGLCQESGCELPFELTVACPLPKGDREQLLMEKLTEVGVSRFVPLRTARSVIHPQPHRLERLRRHVIEASKQCGRNQLMQILPLAHIDEYINGPWCLSQELWLGHVPGISEPAWCFPTPNMSLGKKNVAIAIGPEGGWTAEEVDHASQSGWRLCSLGRRKLRLETAAILLAYQAVQRFEGNAD